MTKPSQVSFSNSEVAFAYKTDKELKHAARIFKMMNKKWLVNSGSKVGLTAFKLRLPLVNNLVKSTVFDLFVGGQTLLECQSTIDKLFKFNVQTILDYGAEAKESELDFNKTMNETIRAIEFANTNESTPIISTKITGLGRFGLLASLQNKVPFTKITKLEYRNILKRLDTICYTAHARSVGVYFDAEETWIQDIIDHLVRVMMKRYNKEKVIVYNTFQMYRKDRLQFLIDSHQLAMKDGYLLGAKIVRGAYMEKERARATSKKYESPINPSKAATDDMYNTAIKYCVDHYKDISFCNATHNADSNMLLVKLIEKKGIEPTHPHVSFCQLYGMSDNISFNLANAGFNVAKYVPYGQVQEVMPYLIRRAQENSAVAGEMSREYKMVIEEIKRRGL